MDENDFPALYRSADTLSLTSQNRFFRALKAHLFLLVCAAILSVINIPHWSVAALQLLALLLALFCSIYLFGLRPDRYWYAGRAVAESIKTITWRFICRAEPFQASDAISRSKFQLKLKQIIEQNRDVAGALTDRLEAPQISNSMNRIRGLTLDERKEIYAKFRVADQHAWYAKKANLNRTTANRFFSALILINVLAVVGAILRIRFFEVPFWPTDVFVAGSACVLSWIQAKRFSELAVSYALTAHEIGIIKENSLQSQTDEEFSLFVGDAENAFSREHTQWVARKDA
jgi:hypothetical protein